MPNTNLRMMTTTTIRSCSNCGTEGVVAKGLCWACYQYQRRNGGVRPITLNTPVSKFLALVKSMSPLGCWLWQGNLVNGHPRYGQQYAHRYAWELLTGSRPKGRLLKGCDQRLCVNPLHMVDNRTPTV